MTGVSRLGSLALLTAIGISLMSLQPTAETSVNAGMAARIVGIGILFCLAIEYSKGPKNLLRADIVAIIGIYVLTLYEFLFEQAYLNRKISISQAYGGIRLILIGLLFLVVGRHLFMKRIYASANSLNVNVKLMLRLYYLCFFLGFIYILITVNFNPVYMIESVMRTRFSQPWSRGKLGGWFVFLSELQLFTYAIPPLAGILFNSRRKISAIHSLMVLGILVVTLFMGFAGGTRNVFFSYLIGLIGGYLLTKPNLNIGRLVVPFFIILTLAYTASTYMIQFRSIGLTNYLNGYRESAVDPEQVYVDHNLFTIGLLEQSFPVKHEFLGSEVFVWALVKPIPRALWPSKPEGLSVSMEEVAGVEGYTLASTYIGESYMAGGMPVVIVISLLFGYLTAWWNSKAMGAVDNEQLLLYAMGLFAVGITMRSLFMLTTAILPVIGVRVLQRYLLKSKR